MLTNKEIQRQMQLGNIAIENLGNHSLSKPNSCDLRIGNTLYTFDYNIVDTRNSKYYLDEVLNDNPQNLKKIIIPETGLLLQPQKVYLAKTVEKVTTQGFIPVMQGKTSFSLLGVSVSMTSGYCSSDFDGHLFLSIVATKPTIIYPDLKIVNLTFYPSLSSSIKTRQISDEISSGIYNSGMLSGEEIKRRMQGDNPDIIITPKDKIKINPNSVNLTLNDIVGIYDEPILDLKKENHVSKMQIDSNGVWLYPDEIYLARTNEWTETKNLVPMMSGRSSLGRNGLHIHCSAGMGSLGYKGYWHMGIRAVKPILIEKDMQCCQIYYMTVEGETPEDYRGYMQNLSKDELGSQLHRSLVKKQK